jgi:hypothetical protein
MEPSPEQIITTQQHGSMLLQNPEKFIWCKHEDLD